VVDAVGLRDKRSVDVGYHPLVDDIPHIFSLEENAYRVSLAGVEKGCYRFGMPCRIGVMYPLIVSGHITYKFPGEGVWLVFLVHEIFDMKE
jgi:hypothetical protein